MALRVILQDDHPVLRRRAEEVKKINSGVTRLLDDMRETMREAGGVGLAANQVGVSRRVIVAADGEEKIYELINPSFEPGGIDEVGLEGCLSLPGSYGEVPRSPRVTVSALDREGRPFRLEAEGLLARILQHEIDHLDGVLFTDRALRMVDPEELQEEKQS